LDCGPNGNKLCTLKEILEIDDKIVFPERITENVEDYKDKCIAIPIIDFTERKKDEEMIYLCFEGDKISNVNEYINNFSRTIDAY